MKHIKVYEDFVNESNVNESKVTITKLNPITFRLEVDSKFGQTTLTAGSEKEAAEMKSKIEKAFKDGKINAIGGIGAAVYETENDGILNEGAFDMYTPAGDKACQKLVDSILAKINGDKKVTGEEIAKLMKDGVEKIAKTHREVHDTEPRGEIAHQISKALKAAGYAFYFDSYGHLNESTFSVDIEFENAPDEINLEHKKGKVVIDLSGNTLKQILSSLEKAKTNLTKLDGSAEITATDENGDSDRGIGMEWTLGDGNVILGPDFGMTNNVKSALVEIDKFLKEFKKSYSSLSREEKEDTIIINFD